MVLDCRDITVVSLKVCLNPHKRTKRLFPGSVAAGRRPRRADANKLHTGIIAKDIGGFKADRETVAGCDAKSGNIRIFGFLDRRSCGSHIVEEVGQNSNLPGRGPVGDLKMYLGWARDHLLEFTGRF